MKVAFMGTDGGVCFARNGFDSGLLEIGDNTGNAIFQYALWTRIKNPKATIRLGQDPDYVRNNFDVMVIPAANQVNPAWDLGDWADYVEAVDLPCVVLGLGAQAGIGETSNLQLKEGTRRYLSAIAKRTETIGVRGAYTKAVLASCGVTNVEVIGCPSQSINPNLSGFDIQRQIQKVKTQGVVKGAYVFGTLEPDARQVEAALTRFFGQIQHSIVFQTNPMVLRYVYEGYLDEEAENFIGWMHKVISPGKSVDEFKAYIRNAGRVFSDARSWIDAMRNYDIALGMRIHGAVAAIQSGRLGVCVAFDSRTLELSQTMGYPYVLAKDVLTATTWPELLEAVAFEAKQFDELRVQAIGRMDTIMKASGLGLH